MTVPGCHPDDRKLAAIGQAPVITLTQGAGVTVDSGLIGRTSHRSLPEPNDLSGVGAYIQQLRNVMVMVKTRATTTQSPSPVKKRNYSMLSIVSGLLMYGMLFNYKLAMDKYSPPRPAALEAPAAQEGTYAHRRGR